MHYHKACTLSNFRAGSYYLIFGLLLILSSCREGEKNTLESRRISSEDLLKVNKYLVEKDQKLIRNYVQREGLTMQPTQTGLWYEIVAKSKKSMDAAAARKEQYALILYQVRLLDGTLCYSSDESGPKQFLIGHGTVERGLEEGIQYLHAGDSARFIIPPHLAYGLTGDQNRIPGRAILLYEVRLLSLSDQAMPGIHQP